MYCCTPDVPSTRIENTSLRHHVSPDASGLRNVVPSCPECCAMYCVENSSSRASARITRSASALIFRSPDGTAQSAHVAMRSDGRLPARCLSLICLAFASVVHAGASKITLVNEVLVSSAPPELAREVVTLAYRGILGRDPDAGGLENYVQHLHDGHRQQRGIVWLCSVLLDSKEFKSKFPNALAKPLFGLSYRAERRSNRASAAKVADLQFGEALREPDLAQQLHVGIEGCSDESEPVKATRRMLIRAGSMTASTREMLRLIANRAAFLIAHTTGASLWSESGTESKALWAGTVLRCFERCAESMLSVVRGLMDVVNGATSTRMSQMGAGNKFIDQQLALRAC